MPISNLTDAERHATAKAPYDCVTCGKTIRSGSNRHCATCRTKERDCAGCGRTIRGTNLRCVTCRKPEHPCTECGKTLRGTNLACWGCTASDHACTGCGRTIRSNNLQCRACRARERACAGCGKTIPGTEAYCWPCRSSEHPCERCGKTIRMTNRLCKPCWWTTLPEAERIDIGRSNHNRRRAVKVAAEVAGPIPRSTYAKIRMSGPCVYCGGTATTIDHVRPLSRGGAEHEDNLVPACGPCNFSKGTRLLGEWDPVRVAYGIAHSPKVAEAALTPTASLAISSALGR